MRLLILTQKVDINDDVLGFFHGWVEEFAKNCEKVTVVALGVGEYKLPGNVRVLSLGKGVNNFQFSINFQSIFNQFSIFKKIKYSFNFYRYIWQERKNYDAVFVHMNQIYVLLGSPFWKILNKPIALWYTHKSINWTLKLAEKLVDVIFTASKESFRLPSKKFEVTGHGIDTEKFKPANGRQSEPKAKVIYVGRISPLKNQELLVRAADTLVNQEKFKNISFELVGSTVMPGDDKYQEKLEEMVSQLNLDGVIFFAGSVPNKNILEYYQKATITINLCPTGGLDKAVLEAMACGVPPVVYNKGFASALGDHKRKLMILEEDAKELAEKIKNLALLPLEEKKSMGQALRQEVIVNHNLAKLIIKIVKALSMLKP